MPASVADPVALVLRTALSGKKGPYSHENENAPELLDDRLAASAKRVLLSSIEYEPAPKQQILSMDTLKSKYTLLNSGHSAKITSLNGSSPVTTQETLPAPKVTLFRSEDVKVGWKGSVPVGSGMINMGNTCYMNSTLQALFHIPSLSNWLSSGRQCKNCDQNGNQLCVVCVIAKTLQSTHEKSGSVVKPILVYNRLKMICKHMVHGRQEDAHEFMRYLVEAMEKAYLQSVNGTKLDSRSKETNPFGQIFGGYIRTEVTCLKCKHNSTTFQHFQDIPLDIQHASTLDDALGHYFRRERLEGDNAYKCEKCKSKVPATKKFSIERAPNVLCIQLKRFGLMGGKMSKHIQFTRNLNLNRFLFNQSSGTCVTYKFVSLINHMGPSQHCGHYTAIAEASNGQLYLFDDCSVRLISLNVALSTGAYVLIYEKVQSSSSTPTNGSIKMNGIQANTPAPSPKPVIRPALITEPSRPKINIELKKTDPGQQKPRLIIRNGATSLFKPASAVTPTTLPVVNGSAIKSEQAVVPIVASKPSPLKVPTALVPYDGESSDEEPEKETAKVAVTDPSIPIAQIKATETKWQVSPSPTPLEVPVAVPCNGSAVAAKWQVSDNTQQDNSSSSTTSSGCASHKWVVRSLSDTESERANPMRNEQKIYCYSDTEMDPPSSKATPPLRKLGNKIRLLSSKIFGTTAKQTVEIKPTVEISKDDKSASSTEVVQDSKPNTVEMNDANSDTPTNGLPIDKPLTCRNPKWDGSRNTDTVKELLRMSHSGFSDQVRTWDGGKSHLTKQVEDDKRIQRKRTADDLLDEELDKGKMKKLKANKEENRESSPSRNGYNPFQAFQDRNRDQKPNHYKPDHFKNNHSQNRYGYQGNRGKGFRSRGGSDHHRSKSQSWRRFR